MLSEYRLAKPSTTSGKDSPSPTLSSPSMSSMANVTEDAFFGRADSPTIGSSTRGHSRSLRRASFANFGAIKSQQNQSPAPSSQAIPRRGSSVALRQENLKEGRASASAISASSKRTTQSVEQEQVKAEQPLRVKRSSKWEKFGATFRGSSHSSKNTSSNKATSSNPKPSSLSTSAAAASSGASARSVSAPLPKRVKALASAESHSPASGSNPAVGDDTADMSLGTGIVHKFGKWDSEIAGARGKAEKLIAHLSQDTTSAF